jgi:hypothetical protein
MGTAPATWQPRRSRRAPDAQALQQASSHDMAGGFRGTCVTAPVADGAGGHHRAGIGRGWDGGLSGAGESGFLGW